MTPPRTSTVPPQLPGFLVGDLLGVGGAGAVWTATDPGGAAVAVKVLTPTAAEQLGEEVDLLRRLGHPGLVALRGVQVSTAGVVLVLDRPAGGALASLVAARGALRPGEVASLVVAIATTLDELHRRGTAHGGLSAANVILDADGRPLLSDWGLSLPLPGAGPADPADDVRALAALAWFALTGSPVLPTCRDDQTGGVVGALRLGAAVGGVAVPGGPSARALQDALAPALDVDPARRPTAAALARAAGAAVEPTPVHLVASRGASTSAAVAARVRQSAAAAGGPAAARRRRAARSRRRRVPRTRPLLLSALAALAVVVGLLLAVGVPRAVSHDAPPTGASAARSTPAALRQHDDDEGAAAPTATSTDAAVAVRALAALRDRAVAQADPALLVDVDVPGSLPDRADRAVLASLAAQGTRVAGRTSRVTHTRLVDAVGAAGEDGSQAWVEVTVVSSEHRLVSSAGATTLVPASAPVTSLLVLAREAGRWRVAGSA